MFKENKFNKILISLFLSILVLSFFILLIGQRSNPKITNYEISDMKDGFVQAKSQISLTFNRVMDKDSVENNFKITPDIKGNFTWIGKKMVFTPKNKFDYGENYSVVLNNAKDSEGKLMFPEFKIDFKTKPNAVYYISEDEKTKGYLLKTNITDGNTSTVINEKVGFYSISLDGRNIVFSEKSTDENIDKLKVKSLQNQDEKEINIPLNLLNNKYDGVKIHKVIYGKENIIILAQGYDKGKQEFVSGKKIFIYDLSTTEISLFNPKNKIEDTDTMLYTPDYQNILYRDSTQLYSYASIKNNDYTSLGKYTSINGFNYKQDKLSITDFDPATYDGQYVAYVDKDRNLQILSDPNGYAQEPNFANTKNSIIFANKIDTYDNFLLFGIVEKDLEKNSTNILYFNNNYSSELPLYSPNDKFVSFERYNHEQLKESLTSDRNIFNTAKPPYGQIVVVNTTSKKVTVLSERGRDILWDE